MTYSCISYGVNMVLILLVLTSSNSKQIFLQNKVKNTLLDMGIDSDESLILSQWMRAKQI